MTTASATSWSQGFWETKVSRLFDVTDSTQYVIEDVLSDADANPQTVRDDYISGSFPGGTLEVFGSGFTGSSYSDITITRIVASGAGFSFNISGQLKYDDWEGVYGSYSSASLVMGGNTIKETGNVVLTTSGNQYFYNYVQTVTTATGETARIESDGAGNLGKVTVTAGGQTLTLSGSWEAGEISSWQDLFIGNDHLEGSSGNDYLSGYAGADIINGGGGNDSITGGSGNDTINGGTGSDTAVFGLNRANYVITSTGTGFTISNSSEGTDSLTNVEFAQFADQTVALSLSTLDLIAPTATFFKPSDGGSNVKVDDNISVTFNEAIARGTGTISLKNAFGQTVATYDAATSSNITIADATITINPTFNLSYNSSYTLSFAAGTVVDLSGNAYAGSSDYDFTTATTIPSTGATFVAGSAAAGYEGGAGNDVITGGAGNDWFFGGDGNDTLTGMGGVNFLFGQGGDDVITGGSSADGLLGGDGNDSINGGNGENWIYGEAGDDTLIGGQDVNFIFGGTGNDAIIGGASLDALIAGDGNDLINGGGGNDWIYGEAGTDTIYGGDGADSIYGGADSDNLSGNSGADLIVAGQGDDVVNGGSGDDTLFGEAGNDTLYSGLGNDVLTGGSGADLFSFATNEGKDIIADFLASEGDRIGITAGTNGITSAASALSHVSTGAEGYAVLDLGNGNTVGLVGIAATSLTANDFFII